MKYSIDISRYQGAIDLDILANCGVEIETIIVKSSSGLYKDPAFDGHASKIKNDGRFKLGIYHWTDPIVDYQKQADNCFSFIEKYKPDEVCVDIEQWWKDWNKWYLYIQGKLSYAKVPRVSGTQISDCGLVWVKTALKHYPREKITVYTNQDTVENRAPALQKWYGDFGTWLAQYPRFPDIRTWEQYKLICEPLLLKKPKPYARGMTYLKRWQFSGDQWDLAGTYSDMAMLRRSNLDLNVDFERGEVIEQTTPIADLMYSAKVTALFLNKREFPNVTSKSIGYFKAGDLVSVYDEEAGWGLVNLNPITWVSLKYLKRI